MDTLQLGDIEIAVTRKDVKHVHLSVHPPQGRVTLVAPRHSRLEVLRAYTITRLAWIRKQQAAFHAQARELPRQHVTRESHTLWGRRYLLDVQYVETRPGVRLDHKRITLQVRPGADAAKRAAVMHDWHKVQLHAVLPEIIRTWEPRLGITVRDYYLQRMKTRWGSCNHLRGHIRLNTELVKKPRHLLEYVVVHEMATCSHPRTMRASSPCWTSTIRAGARRVRSSMRCRWAQSADAFLAGAATPPHESGQRWPAQETKKPANREI